MTHEPFDQPGSTHVLYEYVRVPDRARYRCELNVTEHLITVTFFKNGTKSIEREFDDLAQAMAWADTWRDVTTQHLDEGESRGHERV